MTLPQPQKEHEWLQRLVGEWTYEHACDAGPEKPSQKTQGTETVRSLGGLWILGEGQGEMPGGGVARMIITLGFDSAANRFVGTWIGSMMTHLWVYDGALDAAGRVLTLSAEGPSFTDSGKTAKYQDVVEIISDDHRTLTSRTLREDGTWHEFMTAHYRRAGGAR